LFSRRGFDARDGEGDGAAGSSSTAWVRLPDLVATMSTRRSEAVVSVHAPVFNTKGFRVVLIKN